MPRQAAIARRFSSPPGAATIAEAMREEEAMGRSAACRRYTRRARWTGFWLLWFVVLAVGAQGAERKLVLPLGLQEKAA